MYDPDMEKVVEDHQAAGLCTFAAWEGKLCMNKAEYGMGSVEDHGTPWDDKFQYQPVCDMHKQMVENTVIDEEHVFFVDIKFAKYEL